MCAEKGFDAVELDDIDSFEPASTSGFNLTPGDAQNYLAWLDNEIHRNGMTVLWKNTGILSWWGHDYATAQSSKSTTSTANVLLQVAGGSNVGSPLPPRRPTPCGWDDSPPISPRTANREMGREAEYGADHYVCDPGQMCSHKKIVRHLLQRHLRAELRLRRRQVRRQPGREDVLPVFERRLIRNPVSGSQACVFSKSPTSLPAGSTNIAQ